MDTDKLLYVVNVLLRLSLGIGIGKGVGFETSTILFVSLIFGVLFLIAYLPEYAHTVLGVSLFDQRTAYLAAANFNL